MTMKRHRGPLTNGYRRLTITVPEDLARKVDDMLGTKPGLTVSAFISDVLAGAMARKSKRA